MHNAIIKLALLFFAEINGPSNPKMSFFFFYSTIDHGTSIRDMDYSGRLCFGIVKSKRAPSREIKMACLKDDLTCIMR
jgi:hypothetical protein